ARGVRCRSWRAKSKPGKDAGSPNPAQCWGDGGRGTAQLCSRQGARHSPGRALDWAAVDDALERAQQLLASFDEELRRELPPGAFVFDAHVHLGNDIAGFRGVYEELIPVLDKYGVERCFMFCMDEPDRHPAFRAPNDRTLAYAQRSNGRVIPFVRLDLGENP